MSEPVTPSVEGGAAVGSSALLGVGIEHPDGSVICASCGYEAEWEECNACGGEGGHDGYEEDPLWYQPGELAPCPQCNSRGGDWWCENAKCETQNIWKLRKASKTPNPKLTDGHETKD
jgi:hypothetical protein